MPVFTFDRQPDTLAWFGSDRGTALLAAEGAQIGELLDQRAPRPWLWLAPPAVPVPPEGLGRGLFLNAAGMEFAGQVRCQLPLPLPTEAFGTVIVQHVVEGHDAGLLEECGRILEPGGRLWLFVLNPWSPYRARWRHSGLDVRHPLGWSTRLQAAGLTLEAPQRHLGPIWRPQSGRMAPGSGLRAVCVLEAEKRAAALIPPNSAVTWRSGAAPA